MAVHATRRDLTFASLTLALLHQNPPNALSSQQVIGVSASSALSEFPSETFVCSTINQAIQAAGEGTRILIAAGLYEERLSVSKNLTLEAWPEGVKVQIEVNTLEPYVHCLELLGSDATCKGLSFYHSSKSIADNYGILVRGGSPKLIDCTITSSSGSGIGIEGSTALIQRCSIKGCKSHGIAVFPPIEAEDEAQVYRVRVEGCDISDNEKCGILAKDEVVLELQRSKIEKNGIGISLDSLGQNLLEQNIFRGNREAALRLSFGSVLEFDPLLKANTVSGQLEIKG